MANKSCHPGMFTHNPPRQESELAINIKKATSIEEVSPKRTFRDIPKSRDRSL
jgi:hypothetical protein